jgi:hypothetical protein
MDKIENLFREADSVCGELRMKPRSKKALKKFLRDFFSKTRALKSKLD